MKFGTEQRVTPYKGDFLLCSYIPPMEAFAVKRNLTVNNEVADGEWL